MVSRHGAAVLRVANQFSLCHDDALDAYQRALEIYLRRMDTVEPATEGAWLRVVVKHEAMAIRRARLESVERHDLDLDENVDGELRDVEDAVAGGERVVRSVEALHALKPDEARALLLKAEGLSYQEIGRRFGWSYTKVNRAITEGRARFLKTFDGIEAGEQCEQHAATLTALAAGEATSAQIVTIRPHLRHCATCRAAVRDLRFSRTRRIALLLPFGWLARLLSRQDVTTTMYAASNGGGRLGPAAALVGLCLSGVGAGAACVMTGALPAPPIIAHSSEPSEKAEATKAKKKRVVGSSPARRKPVVAELTSMPRQSAPPAPTATAAPKARRAKAKVTRKGESSPKRRANVANGEFGFESTGGSGGSTSGAGSAPIASAAGANGGGGGGSTGGGGGGGGQVGSEPKGPAGPEFGFEGG